MTTGWNSSMIWVFLYSFLIMYWCSICCYEHRVRFILSVVRYQIFVSLPETHMVNNNYYVCIDYVFCSVKISSFLMCLMSFYRKMCPLFYQNQLEFILVLKFRALFELWTGSFLASDFRKSFADWLSMQFLSLEFFWCSDDVCAVRSPTLKFDRSTTSRRGAACWVDTFSRRRRCHRMRCQRYNVWCVLVRWRRFYWLATCGGSVVTF